MMNFETPHARAHSRVGSAGPLARRDAMARNLPNTGANWALDLAKLRHDVGEQMRASGGKQALVAKHLVMLDACCRIDQPRAVRLGEIVPAHFLDKHLMPQTIGLLHLGAIMIVVFGSNQVNHGHSPVNAWDQLTPGSSNSVTGECRMGEGGDSTRSRTFTRSTPAESFGDRSRTVDRSGFARTGRMSLSAPCGGPDFSRKHNFSLRGRAGGRPPRHQRHRVGVEKRLSLVRLPGGLWSACARRGVRSGKICSMRL